MLSINNNELYKILDTMNNTVAESYQKIYFAINWPNILSHI